MTASNPMNVLQQVREKALSQRDPNSRYCTLATLEQQAPLQVRTRTLVVRDVSSEACLLFVNRSAQKNLGDLPDASVEVLFFYPTLMAQFRLRGSLSLMSASALEPHWQHKPYEAKLLDHFYQDYQPQSATLESRDALEQGISDLKKRYPDPDSVPFTENALGLLITADYLEIWQGMDSGLHDRRLFTRADAVWKAQALVP